MKNLPLILIAVFFISLGLFSCEDELMTELESNLDTLSIDTVGMDSTFVDVVDTVETDTVIVTTCDYDIPNVTLLLSISGDEIGRISISSATSINENGYISFEETPNFITNIQYVDGAFIIEYNFDIEEEGLIEIVITDDGNLNIPLYKNMSNCVDGTCDMDIIFNYNWFVFDTEPDVSADIFNADQITEITDETQIQNFIEIIENNNWALLNNRTDETYDVEVFQFDDNLIYVTSSNEIFINNDFNSSELNENFNNASEISECFVAQMM